MSTIYRLYRHICRLYVDYYYYYITTTTSYNTTNTTNTINNKF